MIHVDIIFGYFRRWREASFLNNVEKKFLKKIHELDLGRASPKSYQVSKLKRWFFFNFYVKTVNEIIICPFMLFRSATSETRKWSLIFGRKRGHFWKEGDLCYYYRSVHAKNIILIYFFNQDKEKKSIIKSWHEDYLNKSEKFAKKKIDSCTYTKLEWTLMMKIFFIKKTLIRALT